MFINRIALNNFRIYQSLNEITFESNKEKNVFVVCGNNGFGKTTLLTSLVWCLYGKTMGEVDDIYKRQILEAGGYRKFLESSLNRNAKALGEVQFEVGVSFEDVYIPAVPCNEVRVVRRFRLGSTTDQVEIYIDGRENELTQDVGPDFFINDFLLPKEIAKFFFFDAEKIVSLAEMKSISEKRRLSKAYSEVLGIKKYEDLKNNLEDLRMRFRRDSASKSEQERFTRIIQEVADNQKEIELLASTQSRLEEEIQLKRQYQMDLQEKLIREGSVISREELQEMEDRKEELRIEGDRLKDKVRELLDLAPFAIAKDLMNKLADQLKFEAKNKKGQLESDLLKAKGDSFLKDLKNGDLSLSSQDLEKINTLITKHFESTSNSKSQTPLRHDLSLEEEQKFFALHNYLKTTYSDNFNEYTRQLGFVKFEYSQLSQKLRDSLSKEKGAMVQKYLEDKRILENAIGDLENQIREIDQKMGGLKNELTNKQKQESELSRKVKVQSKFQAKDNTASRVIGELEAFLVNLKEEKKQSLESRILEAMKTLMHKQDFVDQVQVEVESDIIDIRLFNQRGEEISKDTLSKGEQQLYATAILKALVEESNLEFPVFIDSPMQKFDGLHARNIVTEFYPSISKQVVLFPLLKKEMSETEYQLLLPQVNGAWLIDHKNENSSGFRAVATHYLFETYDEMNAHVFQH